jgi:hypothetical protein
MWNPSHVIEPVSSRNGDNNTSCACSKKNSKMASQISTTWCIHIFLLIFQSNWLYLNSNSATLLQYDFDKSSVLNFPNSRFSQLYLSPIGQSGVQKRRLAQYAFLHICMTDSKSSMWCDCTTISLGNWSLWWPDSLGNEGRQKFPFFYLTYVVLLVLLLSKAYGEIIGTHLWQVYSVRAEPLQEMEDPFIKSQQCVKGWW